MHKTFLKVALPVIAVAGLVAATAGPASADASTNGTPRDAYGYCIANHIANFNGDHEGIGWLRSEMTGQEISAGTGNRAPADLCVTTQGKFAPISNNG